MDEAALGECGTKKGTESSVLRHQAGESDPAKGDEEGAASEE